MIFKNDILSSNINFDFIICKTWRWRFYLNTLSRKPYGLLFLNVNITKMAKSLILTYVLWLFGGWFGLHHFYLNKTIQGLLYLCCPGTNFCIEC